MKQKNIIIGNKLSGLAEIVFGSIIASAGTGMLIAGAAYFIVDGVGDLITGEHHYCFTRASRGIKFYINKTG